MKAIASVIFTVVILVIVIGGGLFAYNSLKNRTSASQGSAADTSEAANRPSDIGMTSETTEPSPGVVSESQGNGAVQAPDFTVQNADGNIVKLSDMLGTPIVLNFWASWCPPCKSEMPEFDQVNQELGGSIQFIMVNATDGSRETKESAEAYVTAQGYTFPVYYDTTQDAVIKYGISALPTTVFIDGNGNIVYSVKGAIEENTLRTNIGLITSSASESDQKAQYHNATPGQAKTMMDSGTPYILVDVRTEAEYAQGHIQGAVLIPDSQIAASAASKLPDKNELILVYCQGGVRSYASSQQLVSMGYTNVYDMGGIVNWPFGTVAGS